MPLRKADKSRKSDKVDKSDKHCTTPCTCPDLIRRQKAKLRADRKKLDIEKKAFLLRKAEYASYGPKFPDELRKLQARNFTLKEEVDKNVADWHFFTKLLKDREARLTLEQMLIAVKGEDFVHGAGGGSNGNGSDQRLSPSRKPSSPSKKREINDDEDADNADDGKNANINANNNNSRKSFKKSTKDTASSSSPSKPKSKPQRSDKSDDELQPFDLSKAADPGISMRRHLEAEQARQDAIDAARDYDDPLYRSPTLFPPWRYKNTERTPRKGRAWSVLSAAEAYQNVKRKSHEAELDDVEAEEMVAPKAPKEKVEEKKTKSPTKSDSQATAAITTVTEQTPVTNPCKVSPSKPLTSTPTSKVKKSSFKKTPSKPLTLTPISESTNPGNDSSPKKKPSFKKYPSNAPKGVRAPKPVAAATFVPVPAPTPVASDAPAPAVTQESPQKTTRSSLRQESLRPGSPDDEQPVRTGRRGRPRKRE